MSGFHAPLVFRGYVREWELKDVVDGSRSIAKDCGEEWVDEGFEWRRCWFPYEVDAWMLPFEYVSMFLVWADYKAQKSNVKR